MFKCFTIQVGLVLGVISRTALVFQTVLVAGTAIRLIALPQSVQTAFKVGWGQVAMIFVCTATQKMVYARVTPALLEVDARVSVLGLENASMTNVTAAKSQVLLIWGNTASCRVVRASVPALIMVFVTWILRHVYAHKDGPGTIVTRQTAQEHQPVLVTEAAVIQIQNDATVSRSGLVRCANYLASMGLTTETLQVVFATRVSLELDVILNAHYVVAVKIANASATRIWDTKAMYVKSLAAPVFLLTVAITEAATKL